MNWWESQPYVTVAEKLRQAADRLAKLNQKGHPVAPVTITSGKIANSFWGASWCQNLERYSDYATRLPRGRSYVRNGAVIGLQIGQGQVTATVSGTKLYTVKISIEPVTRARWQAICKDCTGAIDSLVELLQGRIAKSVMERVCRQGDGLFPAPKEIKLSCSCPDWADMCKHVAAALYGVGARLDEQPELLFVLRGVDHHDLVASAGQTLVPPPAPLETQVLAEGDMAALFGLDMADGAGAPQRPSAQLLSREGRGTAKAPRRNAATAAKKTTKKAAKMPTAAARPARKSKTAKAAPAPVKTSKTGTDAKPRRASAQASVKKTVKATPARKASAKAKTPDRTSTGKKRSRLKKTLVST